MLDVILYVVVRNNRRERFYLSIFWSNDCI